MAKRNEFYDNVATLIEEHDFATLGIVDADVPFFYTIGLHERGLPELLIIAPRAPTSMVTDFALLINVFGHKMIERGRAFDHGELIDISGRSRCMYVNANDPRAKTDYCVQAVRYYHDDEALRVGQILLPDKRRRFPNDARCAAPFNLQPVLCVTH